jgi:hypothetical protein
MRLRRRVFLVSGLAGSALVARSVRASNEELTIRRLLHTGAQLGAGNLAIGPILAEKAAHAAAQVLDPAAVQRVQEEYRQLARGLEKTPTLAQAKGLLLRPSALRSSVASAIDAGLKSGQLSAGFSQFEERIRTNRATLVQAATREIGSLLLGNDAARATRAYNAAGQVLGLLQGDPPDITSLFPAQHAAIASDLKKALQIGGDVEKQIKRFGQSLLQDAKREMAAVKLKSSFPKSLTELAKRTSPERKPPDAPEGVVRLRSGASTLYSVLHLAGAEREAQGIAQVAGYAESAAKVLQTVQLLVGAATGWGVVSAMGQLMGGVGALGFFGGGSGAGQADAAQQEVVAALAELRNTIKQEFLQVNAKLDHVISLLDDVVSALAQANLSLADIRGKVDQIERRMDVLLMHQSMTTLQMTKFIGDGVNVNCKAHLANLRPESDGLRDKLLDCRSHYARMAPLLTSDPWQFPLLPDAHTVLDKTFSAHVSTRDGFADIWPAAGALAFVLKADYAVVVPGVPAYQPALVECLDSYAAWRLALPRLFDSMNGTAEQVKLIRDTAKGHEPFVSALRNDRGGSILDGLEKAYFKALNELSTELKGARAGAYVDEVGRLERSEVGFSEPSDVDLVSLSPSAAPVIALFKADDFVKAELSPLYYSTIDVPHRIRPRPGRPPLTMKAGWYRTTARTKVDGFQAWHDDAEIHVDIELGGFLLKKHIIKLKLFFTRGKENLGRFMEVPQTDPLTYLLLAEDSSNVAPTIKASLIDALKSRDMLKSVKTMHLDVLERNEWRGQSVFLKALAASSEFGDGSCSSCRVHALAKLGKIATVLRAITDLACAEAAEQDEYLQACLYGSVDHRLVDNEVGKAWVAVGPALANPQDRLGDGPFVQLAEMAFDRWSAFRNAWSRLRPSVLARGASFQLDRAMAVFDETFPESQVLRA